MKDLKYLSYDELTEQLAVSLSALTNSKEKTQLQILTQNLQTYQIELEMQNRELREAHDKLEVSRNRYVDLYDFAPVGYLTLNRKGCISDINLMGARMLGLERARITGQPMTRWLTPECRQDFLNHLDTVCNTPGKAVVELKLTGRGSEAETDIQLESLLINESNEGNEGNEGNETGCRAVMIDITARKQFDELAKKRSQAVYESEIRLRAIMDSAAEAIVVADAKGLITDFNSAAIEMFGYTAEEAIGKNVTLLMPYAYREAHEQGMARYLETGETRIMGQRREFSGCRKDGSTFPLDLTINEIDHLNVYCGVLRDLTEQKSLERQVAEISTQEQARIGQEIHDGVGQQLTAASLMAKGLQTRLAQSDPKAKETLDDILAQLQQVSDQLRNLTRGLAVTTPQGLHIALQKLVEDVQSTGQVSCRLAYTHEVEIDDPTIAVQLYRIVQEAVNNALKHAEAENIVIVLETNENGIRLSVQDDGKGFNLTNASENEFGLRIMRYRASIIGCDLEILTSDGQGTLITCQLPT